MNTPVYFYRIFTPKSLSRSSCKYLMLTAGNCLMSSFMPLNMLLVLSLIGSATYYRSRSNINISINDSANTFPSLLSKISVVWNVEKLKSSRTNLTPEIKQPHGAKQDSAICTGMIRIIRPFTGTHVHYFQVCLSLSQFSITETEKEDCELNDMNNAFIIGQCLGRTNCRIQV